MTHAEQIVNRTRGVVIHDHPSWAISLWQQASGFMFSRPSARALTFLFLPARVVRLHMLFVFGPIDVIALDGTGRVVALKEDFAPWTFWSSGMPVSAVLEVPAGTIARTRTRVGDHVALPRPPLRG